MVRPPHSRQWQNYDFAANWHSRVLPVLKTHRILSALVRFCPNERSLFRDGADVSCLAERCAPGHSWTSHDYLCTLEERVFEQAEERRDHPAVPAELWQQYDAAVARSNEVEDDDGDEVFQVCDAIMKAMGWDWRTSKDHIAMWIPFCMSHRFNSTIGIDVARRVVPDKQWEVLSGPDHTTVICRQSREVFDLIWWGLEGRLDAHTLNDPSLMRVQDPTLGGQEAYERAVKREHQCEGRRCTQCGA